jgi:N-acyl-D-amino-acid deacylase
MLDSPRIFKFITLAFCLAVSSTLQASPLDNTIQKLMQQYKLPGAAVAVMKQGRIIKSQGYGWANKQQHLKASAQQLFRIASISKILTGLSVLQLIQQGKLHYQDKVFTLLNIPPFRGAKLTTALKSITVRDLLLMSGGWDKVQRSGIDLSFGPLPKRAKKAYQLKAPLSCYTTARLAQSLPLDFKPGTKFAYSNTNYCLLGLLISKVNHLPYTAKAYEHYIQLTLLRPLGITDMQIGKAKKSLPTEVQYYSQKPSHEFPYSNTHVLAKTYAVGGWIATPIDLVKLMNAVSTLLRPAQLKFITHKPARIYYEKSPHGEKYFYSSGFWLYPQKHGLAWTGHGGFTGTRSLLVKRPDGYIAALIFNKRPLPNLPALEHIRKLLLRIRL